MTEQSAKNFFAFIGAFVVALAMFGAGAILAGCDSQINTPVSKATFSQSYYYAQGGWAYTVIVLEGCEYIQVGHGFAHKGNCTNSIHIYKVENK